MIQRISLPLVFVALGCEIQGLDVGGHDTLAGNGGTDGSQEMQAPVEEDSPASGGDATATLVPAAPPPGMPSRTGCATDPEFEKFIGVWEGSVLDYYFEPVMPVRLEVNGVSGFGVCGSIQFGASNPPPPPSDPDAFYPPAEWGEAFERGVEVGYTYTLFAGGAQGDALHLGLSAYELWDDWCSLQPPVLDPQGVAYPSCVPTSYNGWLTDGDTCTITGNDGTFVYPIAKCLLCARANVARCQCTAAGCAALARATDSVGFVLDSSGDAGTLTGGAIGLNESAFLERVR